MLSLKSRLNHLPAKHISNIEEIVNRIVDTEKADIVVLFGFFALPHDQISTDQAYEFLVVTDHHETREELSSELSSVFKDRQPPVGGVIETITLLNINLEQGLFYISDILNEGIILFNNEEFEISKPATLTPFRRRKTAEDDYKEWISKAKESWENFLASEKSNNAKASSFNLNQVVENCYTCIEMVFSHNFFEEHNIKAQRDRIRAFDKRLHAAFPLETEKLAKAFDELNDAYVSGQYVSEDEFKVSKEMLEFWEAECRKLLKITTQICKDKIDRLRFIEKKSRKAKK